MSRSKKKTETEDLVEKGIENPVKNTPEKPKKKGGRNPYPFRKKKTETDNETEGAEKKKKSKYKNNKIFEYEDGTFTANDRQDISPTPEEIEEALKEEKELEQKLNKHRELRNSTARLSRKELDGKIEEILAAIKRLEEKGRSTEKKEAQLEELKKMKDASALAKASLPEMDQLLNELTDRYEWVVKRNQLMKEGKRLEVCIFDSRKEFKRWNELKELQQAGMISNLKRQVSYELQPKFVNAEGESIHAIKYMADFEYTMDGKTVVEDVKAIIKKTGKPMTTADFKIKWKILQYKYPSVVFRIY